MNRISVHEVTDESLVDIAKAKIESRFGFSLTLLANTKAK